MIPESSHFSIQFSHWKWIRENFEQDDFDLKFREEHFETKLKLWESHHFLRKFVDGKFSPEKTDNCCCQLHYKNFLIFFQFSNGNFPVNGPINLVSDSSQMPFDLK